eukprot:598526-Rhodomonas_salina.1
MFEDARGGDEAAALTRDRFERYLESIGIVGAEEDMKDVLAKLKVDNHGLITSALLSRNESPVLCLRRVAALTAVGWQVGCVCADADADRDQGKPHDGAQAHRRHPRRGAHRPLVLVPASSPFPSLRDLCW